MKTKTDQKHVRIKLASIVFDGDYYPRVHGTDWRTVAKYKDVMKKDGPDEFPPVTVVADPGEPEKFVGLDGRHRIEAARLAGFDDFQAVIEELPQRDWYIRSVELNKRHGRALTYEDRITIADRLKRMGYSIKRISSVVTISRERLTTALCRVVETADGKRVVLKSAVVHLAGTRQARRALDVQAAIANSSARRVLDEFWAMLSAKAFSLDMPGVSEKLKSIRDMLCEMEL